MKLGQSYLCYIEVSSAVEAMIFGSSGTKKVTLFYLVSIPSFTFFFFPVPCIGKRPINNIEVLVHMVLLCKFLADLAEVRS